MAAHPHVYVCVCMYMTKSQKVGPKQVVFLNFKINSNNTIKNYNVLCFVFESNYLNCMSKDYAISNFKVF